MDFLKYYNSYLTYEKVEPSILYDGNTVAWYDYGDLSTLTFNDSSISRWNDKLGSGHDLIQSTVAYQPRWTSTGIIFDGCTNYTINTERQYLKTATYTLNQPVTIYIVFRQITYATSAVTFPPCTFDGFTDGTSIYYTYLNRRYLYSNPDQFYSTQLNDSSMCVATVVLAKDYSKIQYDTSAATTGSVGAANLAGFTLGARATGKQPSNIEVKELIIRKIKDFPVNQKEIYNFLRYKNFGDSSTLTFSNSYITYTAPENVNALYDGNTVAWYDYTDLSTLTMTDVSVSTWADKLGSGRNLTQATGYRQPEYKSDGIYFDGVDDYMKTANFTFTQPEFIYIVFKQVTFNKNKYLMEGNTINRGALFNSGISPYFYAYAGAFSPIVKMDLDTYHIVRLLFNGDNSKLCINDSSTVTGNFGAQNMGGFSIAASADTNFTNIQVKEIILRKVADFPITEQRIYNYLKNKYF